MKTGAFNSGLTTQTLKLRVLTPTFIGGNPENNLNKSQYIFNPKAGQVVVLDENKLMQFLTQRKLVDSYLKFVRLNSQKREPSHFNIWFNQERLTMEDLNQFKKQVLSSANVDVNKMNDIHCFVRDIYGQPYLPGSSIKGALRTAVASDYLVNHPEAFRSEQQELLQLTVNQQRIDRRDLARLVGRIEAKIFNRKVIVNEKRCEVKTMTGLSVSDSQPISQQRLCLVKKEDYTHGNDDHHFISVFRECLKPGAETRFTLTLDDALAEGRMGYQEPLDILEALATMTELQLGQHGFLRAFAELDSYLPVYDDTAGLLFLGGGAGYHAKTLITALCPEPDQRLEVIRRIMAMQFRDKNHLDDDPISPRTLKLASFGSRTWLMGICEISQEDQTC